MMRGVLLVIFLLSSYLTFGQSPVYRISGSLHYSFIPSALVVKGYASTVNGTYLGEMNDTNSEFYKYYNYYKYYTEETTSTTFKSKAGIKLGSILSFPLNKWFYLETGLKLNITRFESVVQRTRIIYCEGNCDTYAPKEGDYAENHDGETIVGPDGKPIPKRFYYPVADGQQQEASPQEETNSSGDFSSSTRIANSILYIEIPVTAKYTVWKNLKLEGGFFTSLLVFSDQDVKKTTAEEEVDERVFNKALFALKLGVSHSINQKVEIEAAYDAYLSNIYEPAPEETDPRYHFFSLGISYKLMN